jgi:hypothetical protein
MAAPKHTLTRNTEDSSQHSAGWCVAFVSFKNPATGYTSIGEILDTKELLIVKDDVVSVEIDNTKTNPIKSCSLSIKSGDIYYPNAVSPGDWVFVWVHDQITKTNEIIQKLLTLKTTKRVNDNDNTLINWSSGLKFVGRVSFVGASDYITENGTRNLVQRIGCDAFSELLTKVYFTGFYDSEIKGDGKGILKSDEVFGLSKAEKILGFKRFENVRKGIEKVMENALGGQTYKTPESVVALLLIWLLGIDNDYNLPSFTGGEKGSFNDAILIPSLTAQITKAPPAQGKNYPIYNMYNVILGLQKYGSNQTPSGKNFTHNPNFVPILQDGGKQTPFSFTPYPLKGYVYFDAPVWSDVEIWTILNQYTHSLLNEIYTCLKCDSDNKIKPTIVLREMPFGTGLFNTLNGENLAELQKKKQPTKKTKKQNSKTDPKKTDTTSFFLAPENSTSNLKRWQREQRAMFGELPRWVIDESILLSMTFNTSESQRVNFVQVFGKNYTSDLAVGNAGALGRQQNSLQAMRQAQVRNTNYITDNKDVIRNGLKPRIFETLFDGITSPETADQNLPFFWARIKADHLFNSHLKPFGTIELVGVTDPICEGDNLEIRGVVFHIDSVSHTASISGGRKTFRTRLSVSNGILASSLENVSSIPTYPLVSDDPNIHSEKFLPGLTSFELGREK